MVFLEMSRVETHGGGTWGFPNCIWAPVRKENGAHWPFWEKVLSVEKGDFILHLRGVQPHAYFVGYSQASGDGFITSKRPPDPADWAFAEQFCRADLERYVPFHTPISLSVILSERRTSLEQYFDQNKAKKARRKNLFYVRQAGRLQCQNGAYLSDIDDDLLQALFGGNVPFGQARDERVVVSVETRSQLRSVFARIGQERFAKEIKSLYGHRCCFPDCEVDDSRFLVGSHIARWSDNEDLRGQMGNGLCLCVFHDRAFELGLFTLDEKFRVYVDQNRLNKQSKVVQKILPFSGQTIRLAKVLPLEDALLEHWIRVDLSP